VVLDYHSDPPAPRNRASPTIVERFHGFETLLQRGFAPVGVIDTKAGSQTALVRAIGGFMASAILNLGSEQNEGGPRQGAPHPETAAHMGNLMEETQAEVRRLRLLLEQQEDEQEAHGRRTKILSVVLAVLFLLLAGTTWSAYPVLREGQRAAVGLLGLQTTANSLGDQLKAVEAKVDNATGGLPALANRVDQLQAGMKTTLQTARSQAQTVATQMGERIRADLNVSIQAIQSRLSGVESNQREASEHVAQLEEQITGLKRELASMREDSSLSAERLKKLQEDQQAQTSAMSGLDQRMTSSQSTIQSLSVQVERRRVEFEVQNRKAEQIVPGIFLTIKRVDLGKHEVDATLEVAADSRVLTIRGQGIQNPAVFYTSTDSRPIELVFTEVAKNKVTGYVLMPVATDSARTAEQPPVPKN
jgi:hypothetical protein